MREHAYIACLGVYRVRAITAPSRGQRRARLQLRLWQRGIDPIARARANTCSANTASSI